jgi:Tetratricopeptide repeat
VSYPNSSNTNCFVGPNYQVARQAHLSAWALATTADPLERDPAKAVELAKKAVELAPMQGRYWNTLGVAQYRAGDWKAALEALENSMRLLPDMRESFNTFFLAMAHWQLGEKDKAREWYDRAVQWMEMNQPKNEELLRFRAEAAGLLGVKEEAKADCARRSQSPHLAALLAARWSARSIFSTVRTVGECLPDSSRESVSCRTPASFASDCCVSPSAFRSVTMLRATDTRANATAGRWPAASGGGIDGRPASAVSTLAANCSSRRSSAGSIKTNGRPFTFITCRDIT